MEQQPLDTTIQVAQVTTVNLQLIMKSRELTRQETMTYHHALNVLNAYFVMTEHTLSISLEGIDYGL